MIGVVLGNLGTPQSTDPRDVRAYLKEFLMDPFVIDIPFVARWLLVNGIIAPFRSKKSAHAYSQVWTKEGSPLLVYSQKLQRALQKELGSEYKVSLGMRYGEPSIEHAFAEVSGCESVIGLPLYPHYAESSYRTWVDHAKKAANEKGAKNLSMLPPVYDHPSYIKSLKSVFESALEGHAYEHVLMSYHGLPVRHLQKLDCSGEHCLKKANCCEAVSKVNERCYRAHCMATSRLLAAELGLSEDQYTVSFQSGLGRNWIKPKTDETVLALAQRGVKNLAVTMPAFTADCLETLEEIGMGLRDEFLAAGGESFHVVPCLNDHSSWVEALAHWVREK